MCLIAIALDAHPSYSLILAANRDEWYVRATASAGWWPDAPSIFGGRDLAAGGTWLGLTRQGRLAALTNFREPNAPAGTGRSRGELVSRCLMEPVPLDDYATQVMAHGHDYAGFNLLLIDAAAGGSATWLSNRADGAGRSAMIRAPISAGVHGLANQLIDSDWPKVRLARGAMSATLLERQAIDIEATLFGCLADRRVADDDALPETGVGLERERQLSPPFIATPEYGTRASTVILVDRQGGVRFTEKSWHRRSAPGSASVAAMDGQDSREWLLRERRSEFTITKNQGPVR